MPRLPKKPECAKVASYEVTQYVLVRQYGGLVFKLEKDVVVYDHENDEIATDLSRDELKQVVAFMDEKKTSDNINVKFLQSEDCYVRMQVDVTKKLTAEELDAAKALCLVQYQADLKKWEMEIQAISSSQKADKIKALEAQLAELKK